MANRLLEFLRVNEYRIAVTVLSLAFLTALFRIFFGYGYDNDTYRLLSTIQHMKSEGIYVASRHTGSIVAEFILGSAAAIGGSVASNATSLIASAVSLFYTFRLARLWNEGSGFLVVAFCASNGYFIVASSTSMDYMFAQAFFMAGAYHYARRNSLISAICFAAAAGSRLAVLAPVLAFVFAWSAREEGTRSPMRKAAVFAAATVLISGLFYVPVWISHHLSLEWLGATTPDNQGLAGLLARFVYKSTYLFGPVGVILAAIAIAFKLFGRSGWAPAYRGSLAAPIAVIVAVLAVFFRVPIDPSYLLPALPFVGILLVALDMRLAIWCLIAGNLFANAVRLDVLQVEQMYADPCAPRMAVGAKPGIDIGPGILAHEFANLAEQDVCYKNELMVFPYENHRDRLPLGPPE